MYVCYECKWVLDIIYVLHVRRYYNGTVLKINVYIKE